MTHLTPTRNVTGMVDGALVRVSPEGIATVLVRSTGLLARVPADTLTHTRGRPIKLIRGLCRADVNELIATSAEFRHDAIDELFGRQLDNEREMRVTIADNDVGFRADDARRGSLLALKLSSAWTDEDHAMAADLLSRYSGTQLYDVASEFLSEREIVEATSVASEVSTLLDSVKADLAMFAK